MEFLKQVINELITRILLGPFHFRFIVQPIMAMLLGVRDGLTDAKAGSPPFIYGLYSCRKNLRPFIGGAIRRLQMPVLFATVLDAIVQYVMFGYIRPLTALLVGSMLMALPYSIARGISNRVRSRRQAGPTEPAALGHKN